MPESYETLKPLVGRRVLVPRDGMRVACTVLDVRLTFGYAEMKVSPLAGFGECWVREYELMPEDADVEESETEGGG